MANSLLVSASSASLSSAACDTAKSPALVIRLNCRCSSAWPVALVRNVNDCVSTKANGADSSRSYIPTTVGVGYSLMPSIAPTRVSVGDRYSMASVPKNRARRGERLVERPARQRHSLPLAIDEQSEIFEHRRAPDLLPIDKYPRARARTAPATPRVSATAFHRRPARRSPPNVIPRAAPWTATSMPDPRRRPRWSVHDAEEHFIHHQCLARQPTPILCEECAGE